MIRILKILIIIAGILALLFLGYVGYNYYRIKTGKLFEHMGRWYTLEEFREKYGPQVYEVESKNTPEEVYQKYRQALLDKEIDYALSLMTEEKRPVYRKAFEDKEKFNQWIKDLPEQIEKESQYGNFANYSYSTQEEDGIYNHHVLFEKNRDGYWQIYGI
jgi:hypothetical protein